MQKNKHAGVTLELKSEDSGFFNGIGFKVIRAGDKALVTYDTTLYREKVFGSSSLVLIERGRLLSSRLADVSKSESKVLFHKADLMVTEVRQGTGEAAVTYYTVTADVFEPINNLYVNTESK